MHYLINQSELQQVVNLIVNDFDYRSFVMDALMSLVTIAHGQLVVDCSYSMFIGRLQDYANNLEVSETKITKAIDELESENLITFDTLAIAECNKKGNYSTVQE